MQKIVQSLNKYYSTEGRKTPVEGMRQPHPTTAAAAIAAAYSQQQAAMGVQHHQMPVGMHYQATPMGMPAHAMQQHHPAVDMQYQLHKQQRMAHLARQEGQPGYVLTTDPNGYQLIQGF